MGRLFLRAASFAAAALFLGGCFSFSAEEGVSFRDRDLRVSYRPRPGSEAFRSLHLERTKSVVVLMVEGEDIRANMEKVFEVLVNKRYAVRDYSVSIKEIVKADLRHLDAMKPEFLKKAAKVFDEQAGVVGVVRVISLEPLRVSAELRWVEMKTQKTLWTAKASLSSYIARAHEQFGRIVSSMVAKMLEVLPRAVN